MLEIIRATTPTVMLRPSFEVDFETMNVYFTLKQGQTIVEKRNDSMEYEDGILKIALSQRDTIQFSPGSASIMLNITANDGDTRAGTYQEEVKILDNHIGRILT